MGARYIFRMDDITPDMNWENFWKYINLFRKYNVKPLLGIVPDNRDPYLSVEDKKDGFWNIMRSLQEEKLVEFAQHGYQHVYETNEAGMLGKYGFKKQSEFARLSYEIQYEKIKAGQDILIREDIYTDIWMAPSHSFDEITLKALKDLDFKYITDGISLFPYKEHDLLFVPQQMAIPRGLPTGIITICIHSNGIDNKIFKRIEEFLEKGYKSISFSDITEYNIKEREKLLNFLFKNAYFFLSKIKR